MASGESVRTSGEAFENASALIVGGKATAAAETVDEGDAGHLSFDLSKRLRVLIDSGSSGGTVTVGNTSLDVRPIADAEDTVILVSSATLAASGAWTASTVVALAGYRKINVDLYYTTDATSGTGGYPLFYPRWSNKAGSAPAFGDDVWVSSMLGNDTRTLTTPTGTIATGEDSTFAPGFAYVVAERQAYRLVASANDTDVQRVRVTFDCSHAKFFSLSFAEAGDTSNPGSLAVEVSLSL